MLLRAPLFLDGLLERGRGKLSVLSKLADIDTYLILPKKADQVIVLRNEEVPDEVSKYFVPFVRSPRYHSVPAIESSPFSILRCTAKQAGTDKKLNTFIRSAEQRLKKEFKSTPEKADWYVVDQMPSPILWQRRFGDRHVCFFNTKKFLSYDFYRISPKVNTEPAALTLFAILSSTYFWLMKELYGRTNLGEGALKTEGTDIAKIMIPSPDAIHFDPKAVQSLLTRESFSIDKELNQGDRLSIDEELYRFVELPRKDWGAVAEAVESLVRNRSERAKSLQ